MSYKSVVKKSIDEDVLDIYRDSESVTLSDRGRRSLIKSNILPEDASTTSIKLQYRVDTDQVTEGKIATISIHYTDTIAYLGHMSVQKGLRNQGIATEIIKNDFINYCSTNLGVSVIHGVAKSPEMESVFKRTGFTENSKSKGGWYSLEI